MSYSEHPEGRGRLQVYKSIRKAAHRSASNRDVIGKAGRGRGCVRPSLNHRNGPIYRVEELQTKTGAFAFVSERGCLEFPTGFGLEPSLEGHRSVSRRAVRSRTVAHGSPVD